MTRGDMRKTGKYQVLIVVSLQTRESAFYVVVC
jgi:hypothetical protein